VAATNYAVMMVVGATMTRTTAETVLAAFMTMLGKRRVRTDVLKLVRAGSCSFSIVPFSNTVIQNFF